MRFALEGATRHPVAVDGGRDMEHRLFRYTIDHHHKFISECTCGWRSESSYGTDGMASAVFDRHASDVSHRCR